MGLDQNFFAVQELTNEEKIERMICGDDVSNPSFEIAYFRKFYDLNEFLGHQYPEEVEDFNLVDLEIDEDLLDAIEDWGIGYFHEDTKDGGDMKDLYGEEFNKLIKEAKEQLKEGNKVFYRPWW